MPMPSPDEIIARHYEAIGGDAAKQAMGSRYILKIAPMGAAGEARFETWLRAKSKLYIRTTMPAPLGVTEGGFDGTTAWSLVDAVPTLLPGVRPERLQDELDPIETWLGTRELLYSGEMIVEGRRVHVVDAMLKDGAMSLYFDRESGLLSGMGLKASDANSNAAPLTSYGDYRRFGPVLVATEQVSRLPTGESVTSRVERVEFGPIPDSVFALPSAVKTLLDRQPTA